MTKRNHLGGKDWKSESLSRWISQYKGPQNATSLECLGNAKKNDAVKLWYKRGNVLKDEVSRAQMIEALMS